MESTVIKALVAWACLLGIAYALTLACLSPVSPDARSWLTTLFAAIGLVPPAIYAYWPRNH